MVSPVRSGLAVVGVVCAVVVAALVANASAPASPTAAQAAHTCLVATGSGDPAFVRNFNPYVQGPPSTALVRGAMYEPHWHPDANEWHYVLKGRTRVTLFAPDKRVATAEQARTVAPAPEGAAASAVTAAASKTRAARSTSSTARSARTSRGTAETLGTTRLALEDYEVSLFDVADA